MNQFPPNTNPEVFSISAIIVALLIEDDFTSDELNSIGNWLFLLGQFILTTAAQQQLINNRYQNNSGSRIRSNANDHTIMNQRIIREPELNAIYERLQDLENYPKN